MCRGMILMMLAFGLAFSGQALQPSTAEPFGRALSSMPDAGMDASSRKLLQAGTPELVFAGLMTIPSNQLLAEGLSQYAAGNRYALGLYANGAVRSIFDGTITQTIGRVPDSVSQGGVVKIAAGYQHAVALTADNRLIAWGNADSGATTPPTLGPAAKVVDMKAGNQYTLLLLADGTILSFGRTLGGTPPAGNVKAISAGAAHALALLNDNTLVAWGDTAGVNTVPVGLTGVTSMSAGVSHNLAVTQNKSVVAWGGANTYGQITVPNSVNGATQAVAAGSLHSIALLEGGSVVSWGRPEYIIPDVAVQGKRVTSVAAGDVFSLAFVGTLAALLPPSPPPPPGAAPVIGARSIPGVAVNTPAPDQQQQSAPSGGGGSNGIKPAIIGAIVGVVGGILLLGVLAILLIRKRKTKEDALLPKGGSGYKDDMDESRFVVVDLESPAYQKVVAKDGFKLEGLVAGDPFLDVAKQYRWISLSGHPTVPVEAGVNDVELDTMSRDGISPVVQLSRADVQEQLELVQEGMLGVGGAAIVFQARWPKRFGENGLLAVKVLKDAYHAPEAVRDSFAYESKLLAALRHQNIVRVYGYCLDLPTVCVVLELLPCTLGDILYPHKRQGFSSTGNTTMPMGTRLGSRMSALSSQAGKGLGAAAASQHTGSSAGGGVTDGRNSQEGATGTYMSGVTGTTGATAPTVYTAAAATVYVEVKDGATTQDGSTKTGGMSGQPSAMSSMPSTVPLPLSTTTPAAQGPALTMMEVLQVSADIAAGLAHLHSKCISTTATLSEDLVEVKVLEGVPEGEQLAEAGNTPVTASATRTQVSHIVHRDMKPANVLINSMGRAKISDFGLARQHESTTVHTEHVGAGTLTYMAPELLDSRRQGALALKPTNRVDIYSLGIMMWEMIARQKPFQGMSEVQLVMAVCSRRRPPIPTKKRAAADDDGPALDTLDIASEPAPSTDLSTVPASFDAVPAFNEIISACWRHRDLKRPSAEEVSRTLDSLVKKALEAKPPAPEEEPAVEEEETQDGVPPLPRAP